MPRKKEPTREDMLRAEKEIGENLPEEMKGLDTEDVGDVRREGEGAQEGAGGGERGGEGA